jgi:hypothetical protein
MNIGRVTENNDADDKDDADIHYGYRRSWRRTLYEYQGSSSLTPAQIMEQETYYRYAEVAVQRITYILQLILLHQASYVSLCASIGRWSGIVSMAAAIESAQGKMQQIMNAVNRMFFVARWIRAHGKIGLLYAKDLTVFVRRRHWFRPYRFRTINDVAYQDCYTWFGLYPHNLRRLHLHLRVPQTFMALQGRMYGGEECFLVYLYH